ncbi:MAG: ABC-2 type transport system permease protein [Paraglaciecola sp.]|jgi:ABC-2 type transport system permease protein
MKSKKTQSILNLLIVIGIAFFLNVLGNTMYGHFDLTEEKRFTLSEPTQNILEDLEDVVYVQVLLDGEFPAGFKRLQRAVEELLEDFRSESGYVEYEFINPLSGLTSGDEIKMVQENLMKEGIIPTLLTVQGVEGREEKVIYPWAKIRYKGRSAAVDLLDENANGGQEQQLNTSIATLEYNFANTITKLDKGLRDIIAFTTGHGELDGLEKQDLVKNLRGFFDVGIYDISQAPFIPADTVKVLIVAKPEQPFSEQDKFKIDQYVMEGGKVIWLLDPLVVTLDSLRRTGSYVPYDSNLQLDDLLFKYGIRINPDMVMDLQSTRIPLVVDPKTKRQELFKWPYFPMVFGSNNHPITKNLDAVNLNFPATLDTTVRIKNVKKTVLLHSSPNSRTQPNVTRLNFEILRPGGLNPNSFNKKNLPVAMLLEGTFKSAYASRASESLKDGWERLGRTLKSESEPTGMIVVADGDIARNDLISRQEQKIHPLGYNVFERRKFANKDFLVNAVEYLLDDSGLIATRSKEVKLRLLDPVKAKAEKTKWQLINIIFPLLFLAFFGIGYNFWRRRRYATN